MGDGTNIGSKAARTAGKKIYLADKGSGAKKTSIQIKIEANQNIHAIAVANPNCIPLEENHPGSKAPPKLITVRANSKCLATPFETKDECELKDTPKKTYPNDAINRSKT